MYTITVRSRFSSAHNLRGYKGKCEDLHGHNWTVEIYASSVELNELGMVADFRELKDMLVNIVSEMDHKYLNDLDHFKRFNPTSENIARYVYEEARAKSGGMNIYKVTVWETDGASATYCEQKM